MKTTFALTLAVLMYLVCGFAAVTAQNAPAGESHTLPVLVKVDSKGKVGDISSAYSISPAFQKLIHATLAKMITKPAMKKGKPVASQFVITFGVIKQQVASGQTSVSLKYLGSKALPPGNWHWVRDKQDDKLALANANAQTWKTNTMDSSQRALMDANQAMRDAQTLGGPNSMATPSVGSGH